jgi:hypothetical protein
MFVLFVDRRSKIRYNLDRWLLIILAQKSRKLSSQVNCRGGVWKNPCLIIEWRRPRRLKLVIDLIISVGTFGSTDPPMICQLLWRTLILCEGRRMFCQEIRAPTLIKPNDSILKWLFLPLGKLVPRIKLPVAKVTGWSWVFSYRASSENYLCHAVLARSMRLSLTY